MSLYGQLGEVELVDIVQILHISAKSGTLVLENDGETGKIHLKSGNIVGVVSPNLCQNLGHIVIREKFCSVDEVQAVAELQPTLTEYKPIGALLVEKGKISFEQLRDAILFQIQHALTDLIAWNQGDFHFEQGEPEVLDEIAYIPTELAPTLNLDTRHLLLEAVRIFDEAHGQGVASLGEASDAELSSSVEFDLSDDDETVANDNATVVGEAVLFLTCNENLKQQLSAACKKESFTLYVLSEPQTAKETIEGLLGSSQQTMVIVDVDDFGDASQELVSWLQQNKTRIEIMATTSSSEFGTHAALIKRGAFSVLLKPTDVSVRAKEYVAACMQAILGRQGH
jgi:ActR/RegA family two-component response regulator